MKVKMTELQEKMKCVKDVAIKRSPIQTLTGILFDHSTLVASDGKITVEADVDVDDGENEKLFIPAGAVTLLSTLPRDGIVEITEKILDTSARELTIRLGKIKSVYQTIDPEIFPLPEEIGIDAKKITIPADAMLSCINSTKFPISQNAREILASMDMKCKDGTLTFAGCNAQTIAINRIECDGDFEMMIPIDTISKIARLPLSGEVQISYTEKRAFFQADGYAITSPLVTGQYLNYERMFECSQGDAVNICDIKALQGAISRAGMMNSEKPKVRLLFRDGMLTVSSIGEVSSYTESIALSTASSESRQIFLDSSKLSAALNCFSTPEVTMSMKGMRDPIILSEAGSKLEVMICPINPRPEEVAA